jgi:hypothetical protein
MMARWLLGQNTGGHLPMAAQQILRLLNTIIEKGGDLLEEGKSNPAEKAWLRLSAGCAMLKIVGVIKEGDQLTAVQLYNLSRLMQDPVPQVKEQFLCKLHKGLSYNIPHTYLPTDLMGMYALAGEKLVTKK